MSSGIMSNEKLVAEAVEACRLISKEITVYTDGTYIIHPVGQGWEYQNDPDWLVTIPIPLEEKTK